MKITIALILFVCAAGIVLAFDPLSFGRYDQPTNPDEWLARILIDGFGSGDYWQDGLNYLVKELGNEKLGERIVEFMEPVFDDASASSYPEKKYVLCLSGIHALGYVRASNSLPFLEMVVLHGKEDFSGVALISCRQIMGYSDAYLDLLDRALREGGVKRHRYTVEIDCLYSALRKCERENECRVNAAIRLINNPYGFYLDGLETDKMLLADFPLYTNSVERLAALSAFLDNENTPPEVRAKYEPERDRLKALPPEELVCATDVLNAQLDALLKAAERKKAIARIRRIAVPAVAVILFVTGLVFIRKNVLVRKRNSVGHV